MKIGAGGFKNGQSGNPAGKARGTRNRTTLALEALLEGEAEVIIRKAMELAQEGDTVALRLCMDWLIPVRKDHPVRFEIPAIETVEDLLKATHALLQAVAAGDLTPSKAADVGRAVDAHVTGDRDDRPARAHASDRGGEPMTVISLNHRLRKFESRHGYRGDVRQMSDQLLDALIRASYRDLRTKHGSIAQPACHLRATGDEDAVALAILIEDDIQSERRPNEP